MLTWTCHGSRLHGDERGSVDDRSNQVDTPRERPNPNWQRYERELGGPAVSLSLEAGRVTHATIEAHCKHRTWDLHTHNVRQQHVHVVLSCPTDPDTAMDQLKAWCTRRLREAALFGADAKVWTIRGSTGYLWTMNQLVGAVEYVRDGQGPSLL
jgi:hypothetical protein